MCAARRPRIGLVVNPVAGMGGAVGLHGTDGPALLREATARGARPCAMAKVGPLVDRLQSLSPIWVTGRAENAELPLGSAHLVAEPDVRPAERTRALSSELAGAGIDLLVVAGGDGTARDVLRADARGVPVVGVPCGVKMFSAVYARSAAVAGDLARDLVARRPGVRVSPLEVMDADGSSGDRHVRLYGYLDGPFRAGAGLRGKAVAPAGDTASVAAAAGELAAEAARGGTWLVGPGQAGQLVLAGLGLEGTLLGVDIVVDGHLVVRDATAYDVERHATGATAVLGVIGGQGYLLGRGNHELTPLALRSMARIVVVSGPQKLATLPDRALLVDTGDPELDAQLRGHVRVVTGARTTTVVPVR